MIYMYKILSMMILAITPFILYGAEGCKKDNEDASHDLMEVEGLEIDRMLACEDLFVHGLMARMDGCEGDADKAFTRCLELDPKHAAAYYERGWSRYHLQRYECAVSDFQEALVLNPNHIECYIACSLSALSAEQPEIAKEALLRGLVADTGNRCGMSGGYSGSGDELDPEDRVEVCSSSINSDGINLLAYYLRANARMAKGQPTLAMNDYMKSLEIDSDFAAANASLGWLYLSIDELDEALEYLNKAGNALPEASSIQALRASCYERMGRLDEADQAYSTAEKCVSCAPENRLKRAFLNIRRGFYETATDSYLVAVTENESSAKDFMAWGSDSINETRKRWEALLEESDHCALLHYMMGNLHYRSDNREIAHRCYQKCLDREPRFWPGYKRLADLALDAGDTSLALENMKKAIEAGSNTSYLHRSMGQVLQAGGDNRSHMECLETASRIDDRNGSLHRDFGVALQEADDNDKALRELTKAIRCNWRDSAAYSWRGYLRVKSKNDDGVISDMTMAIRLNPDHIPNYLFRGLAWLRKGERNTAIEDLSKAFYYGSDKTTSEAYSKLDELGVLTVCTSCNGHGRIEIVDMMTLVHMYYETCGHCNGRKYLINR